MWEDGRENVECDGEGDGMEILTQKCCPLVGRFNLENGELFGNY